MAVPVTQITGNILSPSGEAPTSGRVTARLSAPGSALDGLATVRVGAEVSANLTTGGAISIALVPNDDIVPSGTFYLVTIILGLANGRRMQWAERWSVPYTPTPIDVGSVPRLSSSPTQYYTTDVAISAGVVQQASDSAAAALASEVAAAASEVAAEAAQAAAEAAAAIAVDNPSNLPITATGSTASRTLAVRFSDIFNVQDFGAVGDGVTNDLTAIRAAITAAAGGGTVFFPPGTYLAETTPSSATLFPVSTSNITIRGSGKKASIIKSSAAMGNGHKVFVFTGTAQALEDLGFDAAVSTTGQPCILFSAATDGAVRRCWFAAKFGWSAMAAALSSRIVIADNISDGTTQSHNFEINGSSYCVVERNEMNSNASTGLGVEIYDNKPDSVTRNIVRHNWIHGSRPYVGIQVYGGKHTIIEGNLIEETGGAGIFLDASSIDGTILCEDTNIIGNTVRGALGSAGIYVGGAAGGCKRTTVSGNVCTDGSSAAAGVDGIIIGDTARNTTVTGNVCSNNGGNGFSANAGTQNLTMTGNLAIDNSGVGVSARYGFQIYATFAQLMGNVATDTRAGSARQVGMIIGAGSTNVKLVGNSVPYSSAGPYINDAGTLTFKVGNYGSPGGDAKAVTGSRAGNAALASLLTGLAAVGLIVDSSSA